MVATPSVTAFDVFFFVYVVGRVGIFVRISVSLFSFEDLSVLKAPISHWSQVIPVLQTCVPPTNSHLFSGTATGHIRPFFPPLSPHNNLPSVRMAGRVRRAGEAHHQAEDKDGKAKVESAKAKRTNWTHWSRAYWMKGGRLLPIPVSIPRSGVGAPLCPPPPRPIRRAATKRPLFRESRRPHRVHATSCCRRWRRRRPQEMCLMHARLEREWKLVGKK